ncbi:AEC family transporter [Clostridium tagluense]|uniref:AEC family transporter n=1 Tax=Clostridium tagluense TaxID=360422 RepID=UPI001CF5EC3D|nr:AEC family transporter [Clostridium tagluense]MCB2309677.1 AEC family transporter [Clostridium tagluense]MCB2314793.1 AEC family transporter [Clostridium tagluense]MCB2319642.1 AEC family transporter [Clostridium tagluense]MCB2324271.1 AEC family transporter [Clostridium tagluense]MCB2329122.1 AEC family transporter [Clostridium tagluense]
MGNSQLVNQVMVLFIVMMVGFYAKKKNFFNIIVDKGLSELLLNITLPFMIVTSFNIKYEATMVSNAQKILIYSFLIHIGLIFISKILFFKFPSNKQQVFRFVTIFCNVGFMGYPVLESIYGGVGVFYAAIFNIPFNLLVWTVGVMLYTGEKDFRSMRKAIANPAIIAVFIGIILFVFSIRLPLPIENSLKLVGSTTTPISMIIVGSMLAEMKFKNIFSDISIYYATVVRLLIVPMLIYVVLKFLKVDELLLNICVILQAMPAAVITAIIAEKHGGDSLLASQCVFITTMVSVITIPIVILFL